jgi:uroporphyrinogen-III decarboxylase
VNVILPDIAASGLNVLCPLEGPPGGDVDLVNVKREYGSRLCLKGNVSTNLLLYGTPEQVREAVRACADAGKGAGGFILGTGDQVARDTPFENIEAFVAAGIAYGAYK